MTYRISNLVARIQAKLKKNKPGLALQGGSPVRPPKMTWPRWPIISWRERYNMMRTLEGGNWWYSTRVAQFEKEFAEFQGAQHCITCSSGTTGLEICLEAIDIAPGDEVIVPAFTFFATASCVMRFGGIPVFVDVDDSWCIDPSKIEAAISPRTKAIIPVHYAGRVADMDRIMNIAKANKLRVIEDACHAWGSQWNHQGAGTIGDAGVFSFQMSKNLSAGEGGCIVTNNGQIASKVQLLTNIGMPKGRRHYHEVVGTNARITEFQAGLLSAQLTRLLKQTQTRAKNAQILDQGLQNIEGLSYPRPDERINRRSYHYYCVLLDPEKFGCSRELFIKAVEAEGGRILLPYPDPLYCQPAFSQPESHRKYDCPISENLCWVGACWIPHPVLLGSERDMHDILEIFAKVKRHAAQLSASAGY